MKSLLVSLAFVLGGANAYAQVQTVTSVATKVQTAVSSSRAGVSSAVQSRIALIAGSAAGAVKVSDASLVKLSKVADQIEVVAKSNDDDVNGLTKAQRLDALQLVFLALVKNNSADSDLDKVVTGELYTRAIQKVPAQMNSTTYEKFINFLEIYTNPDQESTAEKAAEIATGGKLAQFVNACGGSSAADRRN